MATCRRKTAGLKPSRMATMYNDIVPEISARRMQEMPAATSAVNPIFNGLSARKMQTIQQNNPATNSRRRNSPQAPKATKYEPTITSYILTNEQTRINPAEYAPVDFTKQQSDFSPILIADDEQITRELKGLSNLLEAGFITPNEYNKRRKCLLVSQKLTSDRLYMVFQPRWEWM
mmetsp:Transcript_9003/g.9983  ORF Transcript_9003/g.9983 Transcript_9003/m.9983 type:complete len:175 (+) Transcript_9003:30-554(+)